MKRDIILASASKRRCDILNSCGIRHKAAISNAVELHDPRHSISYVVMQNAQAKARKVALKYRHALVIGCDTLVLLGARHIGKPRTKQAAMRLLSNFSGKKIDVFTGIYIIDTVSGKAAGGFDKSSLRAEKMKKSQIEKLFEHLGPHDKAGGFSIEGVGSMLFDNIRGSFFNILGLPMIKLKELFAKLGFDIIDFIE